MALHVIRDSQGRVEKYLTEKEFQKYKENKGCFKLLLSAKTSSLACTCMHAHASLEK